MRFINLEDNWLDTKTNLIWKQEQESLFYTYSEALELQNEEWRLPTIEELLGIVDYTKFYPATELPNTTNNLIWSSTIDASSVINAWLVNMSYGLSLCNYIEYKYNIRLVKNGV